MQLLLKKIRLLVVSYKFTIRPVQDCAVLGDTTLDLLGIGVAQSFRVTSS